MDIREINSVANFATIQKSTENQDAVGIAVLKKAIDVQASTTTALIEALPPATPVSNLPPHLGSNINTTA